MTPDQPPPRGKVPELGTFENRLLKIVVGGALGVGGLGLYSSYDSVSAAAARWGFDPAWILPVALDTAIPVFSLVYLLLIRFDMALAWVRPVPWALTAVTVYLNVSASEDNPAAKVGHGALPMLWVICSEIAAHVYRVLIGHATGRRMERVRRSRWILAPFSTLRLWRRMVLREVTSYRVGLRMEEERQLVRADLQDRHGWWSWRWKTTRRQRVQLRFGELRSEQIQIVPVQVPAQLAPAAEREPETEAAIDSEPAPELEPARSEPAGPAEPAPVPVEQRGERGPEPVEPEPEPAPEPEREPERNAVPEPETPNLNDRAAKKEAQVRQVMELLERFGTDVADLKFVVERTKIPRTTAYHRMNEAKARLERQQSSGTTGTAPRRTGT